MKLRVSVIGAVGVLLVVLQGKNFSLVLLYSDKGKVEIFLCIKSSEVKSDNFFIFLHLSR